jgi:hypothetical protein
VSPMHLDRYIDEQALRFKARTDNDAGRFRHVMKSAPGRRNTYATLTGSRKPPK